MAGWIKMPLGMEIGLGPGDFVLDEDPAPRSPKMGRSPASPPQKGHTAPQISAHVYCGQMARWIKMALGIEVGFSPYHIVLDGDPAALPRKGGRGPRIFGPFLLWPNSWMDQDTTWYGVGLGPGNIVLDGDPAPTPQKGHSLPPNFRPMSIVANRLYASGYHLVWR